jgi:pSer/pThr/pTyr-binding forkhead associated (FHA) protein
MPKLHILSPGPIAKTIDLTSNLMTIGRTEENTICIPDDNVSKRHGILVRDGDEYQLHDFNSTNGTFVDGQRIMAVKLQHSVSIRLGAVELRYESAPAEQSAAPGLVAPLGSNVGLQPAMSRKDRGMSKKAKPDFAGAKLQTGPVTLNPGFATAKPIPPAPSKTSES